MHKQHHSKQTSFFRLTPLLDKEFDEKQPDGFSNYQGFKDYPVDEIFPLLFDEHAIEIEQ